MDVPQTLKRVFLVNCWILAPRQGPNRRYQTDMSLIQWHDLGVGRSIVSTHAHHHVQTKPLKDNEYLSPGCSFLLSSSRYIGQLQIHYGNDPLEP